MGTTRKYQPIWEKIKAEGKCELAAPIPYHPRIKKAVLKEKDNDLGFKVLLGEKFKRARLEIETQGVKMIFKLILSIGLGDI